jgi:hypothetical protein
MRAATPLGQADSPSTSGSGSEPDGDGELAGEAASARLEMARELLAAVEAYGLAECWTWKPLMDGKKVGEGVVRQHSLPRPLWACGAVGMRGCGHAAWGSRGMPADLRILELLRILCLAREAGEGR